MVFFQRLSIVGLLFYISWISLYDSGRYMGILSTLEIDAR